MEVKVTVNHLGVVAAMTKAKNYSGNKRNQEKSDNQLSVCCWEAMVVTQTEQQMENREEEIKTYCLLSVVVLP